MANTGCGPASERTSQKDGTRRKRIFLAVGAAAALLLAVGAAVAFAGGDDWFDPNAEQGFYEGKTEEEIQEDLNRVVGEGMMNISIAGTIRFEDGGRVGIARFENIQANHVDQKLTITLADTGEVIYESGAVAPGYYIEAIEINRDLEPGVYEAVATFQGYDPQTHEPAGGALAATITLAVE